ncbi:hypothetical protein EK21DRAFT_69647, partial [Setomelanomma holmii]
IASRFFKDTPSQDEKVANAGHEADIDFDAGIQGRDIKKKPSRFFPRKNDKEDKPLCIQAEARPKLCNIAQQRSASEVLSQLSDEYTTDTHILGSRLFRNDKSGVSSSPPPPLPPQIPVDLQVLPPQKRSLTPLHTARSSRSSSKGKQSHCVFIGRPTAVPQYSSLPIPGIPITVQFEKRPGPPPSRPPRPESLDDDILAFMQQGGTRMVLTSANRMSDSTASASTPRSHVSSVASRLGPPCGTDSPRTHSLESSLAARFPMDPLKPLPVRDSTGSIRYSAFSQYIRHETGGYAYISDGVDDEDRDLGPIEQYDPKKEGEWKLLKRVSQGSKGNPGTLFRDRSGGFHFVADI